MIGNYYYSQTSRARVPFVAASVKILIIKLPLSERMTFIIMEEETRYFYQPDLTGTIISWCWTFLFFIAGLVIWLEITHFQWLSALFFAVFVILALLEWRRRTVVITPTKMVFNRLLQKQYLVIPISDIRQPEFTKHTVTITVNGEVMSFTFTTKAIARLKLALKQQGFNNCYLGSLLNYFNFNNL